MPRRKRSRTKNGPAVPKALIRQAIEQEVKEGKIVSFSARLREAGVKKDRKICCVCGKPHSTTKKYCADPACEAAYRKAPQTCVPETAP